MMPDHTPAARARINARFPYGFECVCCKRSFERLLEAQTHCCTAGPDWQRLTVVASPPLSASWPWWRRLWAWLKIDS
jgi:hypothetical protein